MSYPGLGLSVFVLDKSIVSVTCGSPSFEDYRFAGNTKEGIGIGSAKSALISAYGQPDRTRSRVSGGDMLDYPSRSLSFLLVRDRVREIIVQLRPQTTKGPNQEIGPTENRLSLVCRNAELGDFRHGTRCVGYYNAAQLDGKPVLVDIQLAGKESQKPYTKTKSLVHAGVDIVAPEGTEIHPIADGTVDDIILSTSDENFGTLGYMVIVQHAEKSGASRFTAFTST